MGLAIQVGDLAYLLEEEDKNQLVSRRYGQVEQIP